MTNIKEISKESFGPSGNNTTDIQLGCTQRMADAMEKIAFNYSELIDERNRYKKWYLDKMERIVERDKTISNLRGQITKLKNKLLKMNAA